MKSTYPFVILPGDEVSWNIHYFAAKQQSNINVQTDEFLLPFFDWKKIWTVIFYFMDLDLELHGIYFAFVPLHLTPYPVSICILSYHAVKRPQGFESCYKRHYFERTRGA